jgi:aminoglycoside phosphotransferase (APT) family kinase protein
MGDVEGIAAEPVTRWFQDNVEGVEPPLTFALVAGGRSNLTYRVDDAGGGSWVLRRPPLGHLLPTAHDMAREHRIIAALGPTPVPVPEAIGLCEDEDVNDRPFYVMEFVDGHIVRTADDARRLGMAERGVAGENLADVLADLHAVDLEAVGLDDLGKKEAYIERQLKRWYGQWEKSKTRELPLVDAMYKRLSDNVPEQGAAGIVHGDYRLDNCVLGDDGRVKAVLDWELCTLGDPLADVGLLNVYWSDPDDPFAALLAAPTTVEGFRTRAQVSARYAERSGRDLSQLPFYVAFGYWKLACILEGVYARYVGGNMGRGTSGFEGFAEQVTRLAEMAEAAMPAG